MGKIVEKDGHIVEEGFFGDCDLGELHTNWDGSRETRNIFGENYTLEPDRSFLAQMGPILAGPLAPLCKPADQIVTKSGGETGRMEYDWWRGRREYHPDEPDSSEISLDYLSEGHSDGSGTHYNAGSPGVTYKSNAIPAPQEEEKKKWGFWDYALAGIVAVAVIVILDRSDKK
jgi:hypothetical protein